MAERVRFYRGAQGASLPAAHQDGAIFIVERDEANNLGDMYVDMDSGKRLHIVPDSGYHSYPSTTTEWINTPSKEGAVYVIHDGSASENQIAVKIGDGKAYIGDLPTYWAIPKEIVNNKINAYMGNEYRNINKGNAENLLPNSLSEADAAETLVLTRELWLSV